MAFGLCKLTKKSGTYVDSHIIPLALTKPISGQYFIEGGPGIRPIRRHSSWYDNKLVTRKGEDILSSLDSRAISILREHKIVWSGWAGEATLSEEVNVELSEGYGIRTIHGADVKTLRLFFLSLLWRAASSNRPEFAEISLSAVDIEKLRIMIVDGDIEPLELFPIQLTQLSTYGPRHNLGPIVMEMLHKSEPEDEGVLLHTCRFYFDGLIANVFLDVPKNLFDSLSGLYVGGDEDIIALCIPFEKSFQLENLEKHMHETARDWPEQFGKLIR
ncbi:hypothetical protein [Pseudomonas migulae]